MRSGIACAAMIIAGIMVTTAHGAVVLRNAPWAASSVVTNGMGAAHNVPPENVTNFTVEAWVKPTARAGGSGN